MNVARFVVAAAIPGAVWALGACGVDSNGSSCEQAGYCPPPDGGDAMSSVDVAVPTDAHHADGDAGGGSTDAPSEAEAGCPASTPDECAAGCTNTQTDPQNCGVCGKVCPGPDGGAGAATCTAGHCSLGCSGSTPDNCNGGCVNTSTDPNHCGSCTTVCPGPATAGTGQAACSAGPDGGPACALACSAPTTQVCGGDCVDPTTPAHCGSQCLACPGPTTGAGSGSAVCTLGDAGVGVCSVQCSTADGQQCPAAGGGTACFAPNDLNNCGHCGNACTAPPSAQGTAVCQGSPLACGVSCNAGYHTCVTASAPDGDCLSNGDVPSQTTDLCVFSVPGAVFVSATTGSDASGQGTAASPFASITHALAHLGSTARVYVCNGSYSEQVSITGAVSIFGGLSCTAGSWSYVGGHATVTGPANQPALSIAAGAAAVDIEDMAFTSPNASGVDGAGNGLSSIAALVNASTNVTLKRTALTAGNGASASSSPAGTQSNYSAGAAPAGSSNTGASGGAGGTASCSYGSSIGGSGGTAGGAAATPGTSTPAATVGVGAGYTGAAGAPGKPGASGAPQAGGVPAASYGTLTASGWTPTQGAAGSPGNPGQGGGGGNSSSPPPTGGTGGGAGGCGGGAGLGGAGGGASIALASIASTVSLDSGCALSTATGGNGQPGGTGEAGQAGGLPGTTALGSTGGEGGNGAGGSGGAGGTGGISVCIAYTAPAPTSTATCTSTAAGQPGPAGAGAGGGDNGDANPGEAGNPGAPGLTGTTASPLLVP